MTLAEYMAINNLDDDAMAALLESCTAHAVKKWKYRERVPRRGMLQRISQVTNGQVTANDFVSPDDLSSHSEQLEGAQP